jgi:hypothetical protein
LFSFTCPSCKSKYSLTDVALPDHWQSASLEPVHCRCPNCDEILKRVLPQSVEFARAATLKNVVVFCILLLVSLFALATNTLIYVGPTAVMLFGIYMAMFAKTRDHRAIGVFLALSFIGVGAALWFYA